jgi:hypothetical protein
VNESRNTNAPISITVLCACLGLLIIGVPAQSNVRQTATEVAQYGAASTHLSLAASVVSSLRVLKIEDRWLPDSAARNEGETGIVPDRKPPTHTPINQVLTVTCLPRAALAASSAKPLTAV